MLFHTSLTIPANTTATAPASTLLAVTHGILRTPFITWREGCADLVHIIVLYHEHQIIPISPDQSLAYDWLTLTWPEHIELLEPPYQLKIVGWNEDEDNAHTIKLSFNILPVGSPFARGIAGAARRLLSPIVDLTE